MRNLTRITLNPNVMGGKPCIRGMRVTVGMVVGLVATGYTTAEILKAYPYLEAEDIREALALTHAAGPSVIQIRTQDTMPEHLETILVPHCVNTKLYLRAAR